MRSVPNMCKWPPERPPKRDSELYEGIRSTIILAHCAAGRSEHLCCGRITIDRTEMLLQCPLCGDVKMQIGREN